MEGDKTLESTTRFGPARISTERTPAAFTFENLLKLIAMMRIIKHDEIILLKRNELEGFLFVNIRDIFERREALLSIKLNLSTWGYVFPVDDAGIVINFPNFT